MNSRDAADLLTDNQARDLQNVQGNTAGAITKRNGLLTLATPASILSSLFPAESTGSPFLIGAGGTSLYSISTGGAITAIKTGVSAGARWEWVSSQPISGSPNQGPIYGMNGIDTPQTWVGSGSTTNWTATTGTVPNGKYMVQAGNRIWVAGVTGFTSRVFFSDIIPVNNGPVSWPTANVDVFDENDGTAITGLGVVGPYILVFKPRKTYVIYNMNTGDARQLSNTIGCIAHRSIAQGALGTYFLSEDRGVYLTTGSKVEQVSPVIQPTFDSIIAGQRSNAAGVYLDGHYYLSVNRAAAAGENDTTLDWDETLQSWWLHTFGSNQLVVWHTSASANPALYSAKGTAAIVDQVFAPDVFVDNGTPFLWRWRGPWQSPSFYRRRRFPTPYYKKRLRQMRVQGTGTVDVWMATNYFGGEILKQSNVFTQNGTEFGVTGTFGDSSIFGDGGSTSQVNLYSFGVANAFSTVFSATSSTADTVVGYALMIIDRKDNVPT